MSELISIRRRIKAVQTTKKIAHAMQLIARSAHSRLKTKRLPLEVHLATLDTIFHTLESQSDKWNNKIARPIKRSTDRNLIILIGSQRGLCGSFNSMLMHIYNNHIHTFDTKTIEVMVVGNKTVELIRESAFTQTVRSFQLFDEKHIDTIAQEITRHIISVKIPYNTVTIIHNKPKTFFVQKPVTTTVIPFAYKPEHAEGAQDFVWYTKPENLLNSLVPLMIEGVLSLVLFESLLSEQAARFIAMDVSTRNAQKLLATLQLQYNKLRQMHITQELIELSTNA